MDEKLKILMLEDVPSDAELMEHALRKSEIVFESRRVDTRESFIAALEEFRPDVALLDYKLPGFNGREALGMVRKSHPDIPVIMVTGALGDEAAIELLKSGARDYVLKDNLARLAPAVREALQMEHDHRARLAAENALRESEIRFRALTENSSDITTVIAPDGVMLFDSPSINRLLGYEPGELLGSNTFDLIHPDDVERTRDTFAALVKKPGELDTMEHRMRTKDGRWRVFESRGVYLPDVAGINGVVINARDITERIQAGLAVRRSERRYRRLFEAAKDGILILHPATGDIIDVNPFIVDMLGYSRAELLQKKLWDIVAFDDVEACKNVFVELRTQGYIRYDNLPLKTKAGNRVDVEFVFNLYSENSHRVMQCNIRDITGNMRVERGDMERMKDDLISTVTHELRTPLTTLLGFVDLLQSHEHSAGSQRDYLDMIGKEGERLGKLLSDFQDIQLIEAGRQEYHFQPVDLKALLEEVRESFAKAGTLHAFDLELPASLPRVHADAGRLHQVLENLLSNAVKFSPQDGHITLGAQLVDEGVEIRVTDPGVGISAADLPKVFDKFYRVKHPMMQVAPGTGLGLALVKNIVAAHGGRVWAESEAGHGSTFYFTLPVADAGTPSGVHTQ
jgi:PAS domain S-box-containing protein